MSEPTRQELLRGRLPRHAGNVKQDFRELDRLLYTYRYTDAELDVIEKGIVEVEKAAAAKELAKIQKRAAIKEARKRAQAKA